MNLKEFYRKVDLLRAGQVVEIDGNYFRAKSLQAPDDYNDCLECSLDSLCRGNVAEACAELASSKRPHWRLELVVRKK